MAALDVAGAITNVKTMLSDLAVWQTICGVASSAAAGERIHLGAIEDAGEESPCPFIILDVDPFQSDWMPSTSHGSLVIEVRVELAIPEANRLTYSAQYSWVWTQLSSLLAGINGAVNGSGGLMMTNLNMPIAPGPLDPDENNGRIEWAFTLSLVMKFI